MGVRLELDPRNTAHAVPADRIRPPDLPTRVRPEIAARLLQLIVSCSKVRLAKWFTTLSTKQKNKITKDVTQLVLARRTKMCNFLEYKGFTLSPRCTRADPRNRQQGRI
jgi:hypothetical protein